MKPGIYLTHKPAGPSSFARMCEFLERLMVPGQRKLPSCHGGTLDPFAEGLLLILAGEATRIMDMHHDAPKEYVADFVWGVETENGDLNGKVVSEADASGLTAEAIEAAMKPFLGWTEQTPPLASAKKIRGEPAYKRVARGEDVFLPPSNVFLHSAEWLSHDLSNRRSTVRLICRGGFYVRALARDVGRALGVGGHVGRLLRPSIGPWLDPGASTVDGPPLHLTGEQLVPWLPRRRLDDKERGVLRVGEPIARGTMHPAPYVFPTGFPAPPPVFAAFHLGKLVAILREEDGRLRPAVALRYGL